MDENDQDKLLKVVRGMVEEGRLQQIVLKNQSEWTELDGYAIKAVLCCVGQRILTGKM